jgi:acyl carrier protein
MIDRKVIRDYLQTQIGKDIKFGDDDSLVSAQLIDSLKIAAMIVFLEQSFSVTFDADDLTPENLDTIDAIVACLERLGAS